MLVTNRFFEERVEQLFDLAELVERIFASAGIEYRIVGGLAVYLYVEQAEPDAGRLTRDIDIAVRREDLDRIAVAARSFGMELRHVAGVDMLVRMDQPGVRRAVHLVYSNETGAVQTVNGLRLIPLAALVRMKLTSFRLKDQPHLKDLDDAGLLTPEIEGSLEPELAERLADVRSRD
jgi:hypothetical protein